MTKKGDNRPFKDKYRIYIYPVILAWLVTLFVRPVVSDGNAMLPTIGDGEVIIVSKQKYSANRGAPEFQQVIAFREDFIDSRDKGDNTIRRVIGLPGDTIKIKDGIVYRNGEALKENYVTGTTAGDAEYLIGENEVFVLGDNREESIDSRDPRVGLLNMSLIRGACQVVVWPLSEIERVK